MPPGPPASSARFTADRPGPLPWTKSASDTASWASATNLSPALHPTQRSAERLEEGLDTQRFGQVGGDRGAPEAVHRRRGRVRREHDDGDAGGARVAGQRGKDLGAVDVGKVEVEEDHVGPVQQSELDSRPAAQ